MSAPIVSCKRRCFVIMPFTGKGKRKEPCTDYEWNDFYEKILKPAIRGAEYEPDRADTEVGNIFDRAILNKLCHAHVVLAILTPDIQHNKRTSRNGHPNANVMYELGIVHALGLRETLLLADRTNKGRVPPFDIGMDMVKAYKERIKYKPGTNPKGKEVDEGETIENLKGYFRTAFEEANSHIKSKTSRGIQDNLRRLPLREKLVLLAAGSGRKMEYTAKASEDTNLANWTKDNPKCLLAFPDDTTILDREIEQFTKVGFHESDIVLVGGHGNPALDKKIQEDYPLVDYVHNREYADQEILGSLISAHSERKEALAAGFTVAYTDLVFEDYKDLGKLFEPERPKKATEKAISFLVEEVNVKELNTHYRYEGREAIHAWDKEAEVVVVKQVEQGGKSVEKVVRIGKAVPVFEEDGEKIKGEFVGVVRFTKMGVAVLESYLKDESVQWEKQYLTALLQAMINREHHNLFGVIMMDKHWWEVDTWHDWKNAKGGS